MPVILDDFGTKFSNIDLYLSLQPLGVKFDRVFFNLPIDVIVSLSSFIKEKCFYIIFEKIESKEELDLAYLCGFNLVQGFYLHKPIKYEGV